MMAPKKKLIWCKWYMADWLGDSTRFTMNLAERGLYRDLLDFHYQHGNIPADLDELASLACVNREQFDAAWPRVSKQFVPCPDDSGRLINRKALMVISETEEYREAQAAKGRLGGRPKKQTESQEKAEEKPDESQSEAEAFSRLSMSKSKSKSKSKSDSEKEDLDCASGMRESVFSSVDVRYPILKDALAAYMADGTQGKNRKHPASPSDDIAAKIMHAAGGASEAEVVACLRFLYEDRGLRPRTLHGPRSFSWFITTVADHFNKKREQDEAANPSGFDAWEGRNETRASKR